MKRKLLILRHGKSDWSTLKPDHERPLTDRGRVGAQRIAAWMQDRGLVPDLVVSSPAERSPRGVSSVLTVIRRSLPVPQSRSTRSKR